jgi:hypothetical protein
MKLILRLLPFVLLGFLSQTAQAQLSGTKTIPGDYASLDAAIADLNTQGVNGPLTITLNQSETSPAGGYVINTIAGVSATNTVTINSGSSVVITAGIGTASGTSATTRLDAIFYLNGCDYVTLDGLTMQEDATKTTAAAYVEFGVAMVAASASNGVQNCTIKNCNISLTRAYVVAAGFATPVGKNGNTAIYAASHLLTNQTEITPTAASGAHSNNTIINNTITNCFNGIYMAGHSAAVDFLPTNNVIGGAAGTGNTITDFGSSTTATGSSMCAAVRLRTQLNCSVNYNTITSTSAPHIGGHVFGIFLNGGSALSTYTTNNNIISLANATTSTTNSSARIFIIRSEQLATWTADGNLVENCTFNTALASGMTFNGIDISANFTTVNLTNNIIRNNTLFSSTTTTAIFRGVGIESGTGTTSVVTGNQIYGNTIDGTGTKYGVYHIGTITNSTLNNNIVRNNTNVRTGTVYAVYAQGGSASATQVNNNKVYSYSSNGASTIYGIYVSSGGVVQTIGNRISDITQTGTGSVYGIYGFPSTSWLVANDTITNFTSTGAGTCYGVYCSVASGTIENSIMSNIDGFGTVYCLYNPSTNSIVRNNLIENISSHSNATTQAFYGIYTSGNAEVHSNTLKNITHKASTTGVLAALYPASGTTVNYYRNTVQNLVLTSGTTNRIYGIWSAGSGTNNFYNNVVSGITVANGTDASAANGIYVSAAGTHNFYNNTVRFSGSIAAGGASGLFINAGATVTAINNIFDIQATATTTATRNVAVIRKSAAATGTYSTNSNNNIYSVPNAANSFYYIEGTGTYTNGYSPNTTPVTGTYDPAFNTACSIYKIFIAGEGSSFDDAITYAGDIPTGTTRAESGGQPVALVTTDITGAARGTTPDIGAYEFGGTAISGDVSPPVINFTDISNSICNTTIPFTVTVTDPSGVNTTAGSKPRVWYKKTTELNVLPPTNTSADNGWKYVEATNSSSPFNFTIDLLQLSTLAVANDFIQYFVTAQDNAGNVAVKQAGFFGGYCATSQNLSGAAFPTTAAPVIKSFKIIATPVNVTAVASKSIVCGSSPVTLSLTGDPITSAEYQWQSAPNATGTFVDVAGATAATYTPTVTLTSDKSFQCIIKCNGSPVVTSTIATVNQFDPQIASTTGAARCGTGTLDLTATATTAGATINWYATATGGAPIGAGSPFTTPSIAAPTTYYAAAAEGGGTSTVGRPAPAGNVATPCGTVASGASDYPMRFNTTAPVTIVSVTAIPNAAGSYTVAMGPTLVTAYTQTKIFTFTAAQVGLPQVLPLGFVIPNPGAYQLTNSVGSFSRIGTFSNTGACAYPFVSGVGGLQIVGSATFSNSATNTNTYNNFFDWVVQEGCESPRVPVVADVTQPPAITMPANITMCSNEPAQGLTVTSTNAGYTYEWSPSAGLNTTSGATVQAQPASTTTYTVTATDNSGGAFNTCVANGTVKVTVNEIPAASDTKSNRDTVCFAENVDLSLINSGNAIGLEYQWQNSPDGTTYTDVPGATTNKLTALVDGTTPNYYQCKIYCKGGLVLTSTPKRIYVNNPALVSTTGATRCGSGTVDLTATATAGYGLNWYNNATGGTPIGTGTTFTTPNIVATKDFYVAAAGGVTVANVGLTAPPSYYAGTTGNYGIIFDALQSFTLKTVDLYPVAAANGTAGTVTIALQNSAGTTLQSITVNVTGYVAPLTAAAKNTVTLDFVVPAGTGYRLTRTATTGITSLQYDCGLAGNCSTNFYAGGYPTSIPGVINQLGGHLASATVYNYYVFYFYNWQVTTACESARQAVTATVTTPPSLTGSPDATICSNGTGTPLSVSSPNASYTYDWGASSIGLNTTTGANVTANPPTNTRYIVTASDATSNCVNVDTMDVVVNQVPVSIDVKASIDTVCFSDNVKFTLINALPNNPSGVDYQWQSSSNGTTFADVPGAVADNHTALIDPTTDQYYRCNITCLGNPGVVSTVKQEYVSTPSVATTAPGIRCGTGTVDLSATSGSPSQTLNWYNAAIGGSPIGTGNTFTTPVITATTDFYVAAKEGSSAVTGGRLTNLTAGSALSGFPRGIVLTATTASRIKEISFLTTGPAAAVTVQLYNSGGTAAIGAPTVINIPVNAGTTTVPVLSTFTTDIEIPATGTYRLFVTNITPASSQLYYEFSGVTGFPYPIGATGSITGSVTSLTGAAGLTTYYYFYKLKLETGCESARTAVTATVAAPSPITVSADVTTCSAGPSQNLTVSSANPNYNYVWAPSTGLSTTSGTSVTALPPSTTTYGITATDPTSGCVETASIKMTVNPSPNDPMITTTVNATPCSTVTKLEGSGSHQPSTAPMGTGTGVNTTTGWPSIIGNYYKGQRHQFIYTKAELEGIGMNIGSRIDALSAIVTTNSTTTPLTDYTVKIGNTTKSAFTSTVGDWVDPTTLTTVFNTPSLAQPATGATLDLPFTAPFFWDGTSNIVIEFASCNGSASTYTLNSIMNFTTLAANQALYIFSDGTPGATVNDFYTYTAANTPTATTNRTNITFSYTKPADYVWSPAANLYTDAATSIPYVAGAAAQIVYAKPPVTSTYTVNAATPLGCTAANSASAQANANARSVQLTGLGTTNVTAVNSCDDGGWTNYFINDKIFFAINWAPNGTLSPQNGIAKNAGAIKAVLDAAIAQCESPAGNKIYAMKRWWNVTTSFFSQPVNVRFYYDPAEITEVMNAAGGSAPTFGWYKNTTASGAYNQATMVTGKNGIANGNTIGLTATIGVDQGVTYAQYDGITSFSGGTGAATTAEAGLKVSAKAYLTHVDPATGLMDDYVKTLANFPTTDPYAAGFSGAFAHVTGNNNAGATVSPIVLAATGNDAIVDWMFLELRSGTSGSTVPTQTRVALLQKDGDIVDMDGVSPVSFFGLPSSHYVAIRHRNHTGFRTDNTIALSTTPATLNFTNNSTPAYGAYPLTNPVGSTTIFMMNGGDANSDGSIDAFDTISWEVQNGLFDDYNNNADYNLDGSVDAFDTIIWELNNGKYQELD